MENADIIAKLATHDAQINSLERRIGDCEETTKSINALTENIAKMTITLSNTNDTVKELKKDVVELKNVPSKRWDLVMTASITALIGGIIGYILNILV